MKKQFLEGRIESIGERKKVFDGGDIRFRHITVVDASGKTTAVSNVIVEASLADAIKVGADVKLALATTSASLAATSAIWWLLDVLWVSKSLRTGLCSHLPF